MEQVTFSGTYAKPNREILYITERCVFRLIKGKMTLTEIAQWIDLEKDILANIGFVPEISPDLKLMEPSIFMENWANWTERLKIYEEDS